MQEESINDTNALGNEESTQNLAGEMSQEDIDKLLNGGLEEKRF